MSSETRIANGNARKTPEKGILQLGEQPGNPSDKNKRTKILPGKPLCQSVKPRQHFIDRCCPHCNSSDFSIISLPEEQCSIISEPAILGIPECTCNGDFFIRIDPSLKEIFAYTLTLNSVSEKDVRLFIKLFFSKINSDDFKVLNLKVIGCSPDCKGKTCRCQMHPSIITLHGDFERMFREKISNTHFPHEHFTAEVRMRIINILFGRA